MKDVGAGVVLYRFFEEHVKKDHRHHNTVSPSSKFAKHLALGVANMDTIPPMLVGFISVVSAQWKMPSTDRQCIAQLEAIVSTALQRC